MIPEYISVDANELAWRPSALADGLFVKDSGSSDGRSMQLVHFQPGAHFPKHRHTGPEFMYVIEGEVIQRGVRLGLGCGGIARAGTEEDDFISEIGGVFVLVYTEGRLFVSKMASGR